MTGVLANVSVEPLPLAEPDAVTFPEASTEKAKPVSAPKAPRSTRCVPGATFCWVTPLHGPLLLLSREERRADAPGSIDTSAARKAMIMESPRGAISHPGGIRRQAPGL